MAKSKKPKAETATQINARVAREATEMDSVEGCEYRDKFIDAIASIRQTLKCSRNEAILAIAHEFPPQPDGVPEEAREMLNSNTEYSYNTFFDEDGNPLYPAMTLPDRINWVANHAYLSDLPADKIPHPGVLPILQMARQDPSEFSKTFLLKIMPSQKIIDAMGEQATDCAPELAVLDRLDEAANKINQMGTDVVSKQLVSDLLTIVSNSKLQPVDVISATKDRLKEILKEVAVCVMP